MKIIELRLLLAFVFFSQLFFAQNMDYSRLYFDLSKDIQNNLRYQMLSWDLEYKIEKKTISFGKLKLLPNLYELPLLNESNYQNNKDFRIQNNLPTNFFINNSVMPVYLPMIDKINIQPQVTVELFKFNWK